jgi:hypothetical protein
MADVKQSSAIFNLDWRDAAKGLLVSVVSAVLTVVYESLEQGEMKFDWKHIGIVAATTAASYLLKNFFTPTKTIVKE